MKKIYRIFSLLFALTVAAGAFPAVAHAENRVAPSGLAYDDIGEAIEEFTVGKAYPSYRVNVFCGDETLYEGGKGYVDKENNIMTDEDTVYEWGSVTKTFIWVSVMQLYEQGKIDLNADVREYLPEEFTAQLKYEQAFTMLDIMNHTTGFEETVRNMLSNDENNIRTLSGSLIYTEPKQVFHPGEVISYSNWSSALAGYVVECISGKSFSDYVHDHIFEPAGMEHTSIAPDHSDNAWVYEKRNEIFSYDTLEMDGETVFFSGGKKLGYIELYPAGAATGTVSDLARFGQALVSDDCPFFEKQETADLMFTPTSTLGDTDIAVNSHGFWCTDGAVQYVGHNGSTTGFSANLQFDRQSKLGCAVVVNQYAESEITAGIPILLFGKPDLSQYGDAEAVSTDLSGTYINSRGHIRDSMRFYSYLSTMTIKDNGNNEYTINGEITLRPLKDRLVLVTIGNEKMLFDVSENGTIYMGGSELIKVKGAKAMHILIFVYIGIAVAGFIAVMVLWMISIVNKRIKFKGMTIISLSHIAKVISCICAFTLLMTFDKNIGQPLCTGIISAIIQTICVVLYALAAVSDAMTMMKEKHGRYLYLTDAGLNILSVTIALVFGICFV